MQGKEYSFGLFLISWKNHDIPNDRCLEFTTDISDFFYPPSAPILAAHFQTCLVKPWFDVLGRFSRVKISSGGGKNVPKMSSKCTKMAFLIFVNKS